MISYGDNPKDDIGMADMFADAPITIEAQIDCIKREIKLREFVYSRRVADGKMSQKLADDEMKKIQAVLVTLNRLRDIQVQVRNAR